MSSWMRQGTEGSRKQEFCDCWLIGFLRLLREDIGIPKLRKEAPKRLKFKGKGHEVIRTQLLFLSLFLLT